MHEKKTVSSHKASLVQDMKAKEEQESSWVSMYPLSPPPSLFPGVGSTMQVSLP